MLYRFWLLLAAAFLASTKTNADDAKDYCNCEFNVAVDEEPDCRVYGLLLKHTVAATAAQLQEESGSSSSSSNTNKDSTVAAVPWHRATKKCLGQLKINIAPLDADQMANACPNPNGTDAEVLFITNLLFDKPNHEVVREVQGMYPQFWVPSNETDGAYELNDVIYDTRNSPVDCTVSKTLCRGTIKNFFSVILDETDKVCKILHESNIDYLRQEQSEARVTLCNETVSISEQAEEECDELKAQVEEVKEANPGIGCKAFGFDAREPPVCGSKTEDSGSAPRLATLSAVLMMAALLLTV